MVLAIDSTHATKNRKPQTDGRCVIDSASLARLVAASRPTPDPSLEQFLMTEESLRWQCESLLWHVKSRSLFVLGDDDHLSILFAKFSPSSEIRVVELDQRVCRSLSDWRDRLCLENLQVEHCDIRSLPDSPDELPFDGFYVNPPYSSKNGGHGLCAWVSACISRCKPDCFGIVAMPADGVSEAWVENNWVTLQVFLNDNGFEPAGVSANTASYAETRHAGLRSRNLFVQRRDSHLRRIETPRTGTALYR